jgi:hypothetical protein
MLSAVVMALRIDSSDEKRNGKGFEARKCKNSLIEASYKTSGYDGG